VKDTSRGVQTIVTQAFTVKVRAARIANLPFTPSLAVAKVHAGISARAIGIDITWRVGVHVTPGGLVPIDRDRPHVIEVHVVLIAVVAAMLIDPVTHEIAERTRVFVALAALVTYPWGVLPSCSGSPVMWILWGGASTASP